MSDKEEFEKWAKDDGLDVSKLDGIIYYSSRTSVARGAWQARQPEIDALKIKASEYRDKCLSALEENAALKAENERLREAAQILLDTCEATNPLINGPTFVAIDALSAALEGK